MAVDLAIRTALSERLALMPYPIAWENVDFTPSFGTEYLHAQLFRNTTTRLFIRDGDSHRYTGFLQVAVMTRQGIGPTRGDEIAEEVKAHFPDGLWVGPAKVIQAPQIADGYPDDGWHRIPVSVFWRAHA